MTWFHEEFKTLKEALGTGYELIYPTPGCSWTCNWELTSSRLIDKKIINLYIKN
jgi:hypothetical protein